MKQQIFLNFLILCMCLVQGFNSLSNNATTDLLNHLVRQKRVIDTTPHANTRVRRLQDVNYIVQVQKNLVHACAGSILSAHVILTLASCVRDHVRYTILSGTLTRTGGSIHDVNGILVHPQFVHNFFAHDIALLSIQQPIALGPNLHQPVTIYNVNNGILPAHSIVTVSGWGLAVINHRGLGCMNPLRGPGHLGQPNELRSITLNTIGIEECRNRHENDPAITNELICTFHEEKYCGPRDGGDPLVFGGRLAGMLVLDGFLRGPDVYVNVGLPAYRQWIIGHMDRIPRYVPPPNRSPSPPRRSPPRRHNHRQPQTCSQVHPCNDGD